MKKLLKRYEIETEQVVVSSVVRVSAWEYPSEIFCCKKGVYIYIELKDREEMYHDLVTLMKEVS